MKNAPVGPLLLLIVAFPLGAAGQNFALGLASLVLIVHSIRNRAALSFSSLVDRAIIWPSLAVAGLILWLPLAALLNPQNPSHELPGFIAGYLPLVVLPLLIGLCFQQTAADHWPKLFKWLLMTTVLLSLICLSQAIWGWEREGFGMVSSETRARGLYSHPLTLAYSCLLLWPLSITLLFRDPRECKHWFFFFAVVILVWTSRSRIIQLVSIGCLGLQILYFAKAKLRYILIGSLIAILFLVAFTNNPVSKNFRETFAGKADRHAVEYPDDRVAFWHAHWQLLKERPVLGHGAHLPKSEIQRAYQAIDLADFKKQYNAHNVYLQLAVEGGLLGLGLYLFWFGGIFWLFIRAMKGNPWSFCLALTWGSFGLAVLTQNALQDYEVRYCLTLFLGAALCLRLPKDSDL